MAEESSFATKPTSPSPGSQHGVYTGDDSAQLRQRATSNEPTPGGRRSSNFSEYSFRDSRRSFVDSTEDLLLPTPSPMAHGTDHESSVWHSAPLAFALLPALGGILFTNGSSIVTDVMLLGLAAIFLNWSVRLPWNWYHSAQTIRKKEEYNGDMSMDNESEDDNAMSFSQATLDEVPEDTPAESKPNPVRRLPAHEAATDELYIHEMLALISCFLFPLLGAYLLHALRSQLTRPSEGLVSNYNLTIFLLASELRPMAHLVKLIQSRTLHLQRVVSANTVESEPSGGLRALAQRLEELESRTSNDIPTKPKEEAALNAKQRAFITTEIRAEFTKEIKALNHAIRSYNKRFTMHSFQTDARLHELEDRLNDAISLAASAAKFGQNQRAFTGIVVEWVATTLVLPIQAFGAMASLPFKTLKAILDYGQGKLSQPSPNRKAMNGNGRYPSHSRYGDRVSGSRAPKKQS